VLDGPPRGSCRGLPQLPAARPLRGARPYRPPANLPRPIPV